MEKDHQFCKLEVGEDTISLSNDVIILKFSIHLGTFSLSSVAGQTKYFSNAYVQVQTDSQILDSRKMTYKSVSSVDYSDERGNGKIVVLKLVDSDKRAELNVRFSVNRDQRGYSCIVMFRNKSNDTRVLVFSPLVVDIEAESSIFTGWNAQDLRYFRNGFQSWDLSHAKALDAGENKSHFFSVLTNIKTRSALTLGFSTMADQFCEIALQGRDRESDRLAGIVASSLGDQVLVPKGQNLASEELVVYVGEDGLADLIQYAELVVKSMNAISWNNVPTGWCSWYYYYTLIDEEEMKSNTKLLAERFGKEIEWIQLDDGYQRLIGDWKSNDKFTEGLSALVGYINKSGYRAGIWTAPFIASQHSNLFKENPNWFVKDNDGKPKVAGQNPLWLGDYYALDLTNSEVISFLEKTFKRLRADGYEYFKIDFLYDAAIEGRRQDPFMTRAQAIRQGVKAIRDAVGDSFILGCGAPLGPCIGIVNGMRIGADIGPVWMYESEEEEGGSGMYPAAVNTITRAFMHDRWWKNDPDCLMLRHEDTNTTPEELRLWMTAIALSGGLLLMSDNVAELSEERLHMFDKLLPVYPKNAVALDSLIETHPRLFALPLETPMGRWAVLGVFNLGDSPINVKFSLRDIGLDDASPHHLFDFWAEQYGGLFEREVRIVDLKPHTVRLFAIRPEAVVPSVLSTSMHFTQGAVEIQNQSWDSEHNHLEFTVSRDTRREESVFIVFSSQWKPEAALVDEKGVKFLPVAPEVIAVKEQFHSGQTVRVTFTRK
ncbi:MAG: alpha-galactosidase [Candidatus Thorarchaeota archaeon]